MRRTSRRDDDTYITAEKRERTHPAPLRANIRKCLRVNIFTEIKIHSSPIWKDIRAQTPPARRAIR